jgi:hypothetical protein
MLQGHFADGLVARFHGSADAVLAGLHVRSLQEEICRRWGSKVEGEGSVRTNSDSCGNGDSGVDVRGSGVELLYGRVAV